MVFAVSVSHIDSNEYLYNEIIGVFTDKKTAKEHLNNHLKSLVINYKSLAMDIMDLGKEEFLEMISNSFLKITYSIKQFIGVNDEGENDEDGKKYVVSKYDEMYEEQKLGKTIDDIENYF